MIEHFPHIGWRHFGKQRVIQQNLQPLDIRTVLLHLQQQILIGRTPGQHARNHFSIQRQHADIAERLNVMLPRRGRRQWVQAGRHPGLQMLLCTVGSGQQHLATEQKVAFAGLISAAKKHLPGEHRLRHQLRAQLTPLLVREDIQRGKTAQLFGIQRISHQGIPELKELLQRAHTG